MANDASAMFVNDQQRHLVQQAQQAQQVFAQPQSSQMSSDVNEDEAMLQEVFNSLNNAGPPQQQPTPTVHHSAPQPQAAPPPVPQLATPTLMTPVQAPAPAAQWWWWPPGASSVDVQHVLLSAGIIFGVGLLPLAFVGTYVPLHRVPHGDLVLKALIAALVLHFVR